MAAQKAAAAEAAKTVQRGRLGEGERELRNGISFSFVSAPVDISMWRHINLGQTAYIIHVANI